jgi:hypothetical protein
LGLQEETATGQKREKTDNYWVTVGLSSKAAFLLGNLFLDISSLKRESKPSVCNSTGNVAFAAAATANWRL